MRLVPPGSKHVHMPALSAVMTWIYVVFAKEIRSTNRTSRGAGLRRFPCLVFPRPQGTKRAENFLPLFAAKGGLWPFCLSGSTAIVKIFSLRGFASGGPAGLASGGPAGQTRQHPTRVYVMGVGGLCYCSTNDRNASY